MALQHNPKIVTNGLVLCLDAGNPLSYSGSGTVWNDLSGNGYNGTLTNGPTFSSNNKGYFTFDGTNDYGDISNIALTGNIPFTLCVFCNVLTNPTSDGGIVLYGKMGTQSQVAGLYYRNSDNYLRFTAWAPGAPDYATGFLKDFNQWHYLSLVYNGSTTLVYRDGVSDPSGSQVRSLNITLGTLTFGAAPFNSSYLNQRISLIQLYNRALTATEVSQNYNATKGRYAL